MIDATGKVVDTTAIYPHEPQRQWNESLATLGRLAMKHRVELIAIGNGTASRETDKLATELVKGLAELKMSKIVVSEAGASVYSASAFASEELPGLDVTLRGAVSIARRLQDPLAELVKIEPKAIGVGQYQHEPLRRWLARVLGLRPYPGCGDADRRARLDGGPGLHHPAPERCALRPLQGRPLGRGHGPRCRRLHHRVHRRPVLGDGAKHAIVAWRLLVERQRGRRLEQRLVE